MAASGASRSSRSASRLQRVARDPPPAHLTQREMEVLGLVAEGLPDKTIARDLGISYHTVRAHVNAILRKSSCRNRAAAVHWWHMNFEGGEFAGTAEG